MPDLVFALASGALFTVGMASFAAAVEFRDWRYGVGYLVALAAACGIAVNA